jgi:hypothetical protein
MASARVALIFRDGERDDEATRDDCTPNMSMSQVVAFNHRRTEALRKQSQIIFRRQTCCYPNVRVYVSRPAEHFSAPSMVSTAC